MVKATMKVTVFIGEDERYGGRPLFEVLVLAARERSLVVEMIGATEKVRSFLPDLSRAVGAGVVVRSDVTLEWTGLE